MQQQITKNEVPEFEFKEFMAFKDLTNILLFVFTFVAVLLFFSTLKYLFAGAFLFAFVTGIICLLALFFVIYVIKYSGTKKLYLLDDHLKIEYLMFKRVIMKKEIRWEKITNCTLNKPKNAVSSTDRKSITLYLNKRFISLGNNIDATKAQKFIRSIARHSTY